METDKELAEHVLAQGTNISVEDAIDLARRLLARCQHDDILAEIEKRNADGAEIYYEVYYDPIGYRFINGAGPALLDGEIKTTIIEAWRAFNKRSEDGKR